MKLKIILIILVFLMFINQVTPLVNLAKNETIAGVSGCLNGCTTHARGDERFLVDGVFDDPEVWIALDATPVSQRWITVDLNGSDVYTISHTVIYDEDPFNDREIASVTAVPLFNFSNDNETWTTVNSSCTNFVNDNVPQTCNTTINDEWRYVMLWNVGTSGEGGVAPRVAELEVWGDVFVPPPAAPNTTSELIERVESGNLIFNSDDFFNITLPKFITINETDLDLVGVSQSPCYQEFSNVSTSCGGESSGTYTIGAGSVCSDVDNMFDGDYNTSGIHVGANACTVLINYTKPDGLTNEGNLWQISDFNKTENLTIIDNCMTQHTSILELRMESNAVPAVVRWQCWNGSDWFNLTDSVSVPAGQEAIFEEAMFWNSTLYPENITVRVNNILVKTINRQVNDSDPFNNIDLNNNTALQIGIDECLSQVGSNCAIEVNVSSVTDGRLNFTWNVTFFNYRSLFNTPLFESEDNLYQLKLNRNDSNWTFSDVFLFWNNTRFNATETFENTGAGFNYTFSTTVPILESLSETFNFHWNYTRVFVNGTTETFTTENQTQVLNKAVFNLSCDTPSLNITLFNEDSLNRTAIDIDIAFERLFFNNQIIPLDFNFSFLNVENVTLCINIPGTNRFDGIFTMSQDGFTTRNYDFAEFITFNQTTDVQLYLSNNSNITNIFATLFDENALPIEAYYLSAERFYPSINDYRVVENLLTDVNGEVLFRLIPFTINYRFRVRDNNLTFIKLIPRTTVKSSTLIITIETNERSLLEYDEFLDASRILSFNNNTNEIVWSSSTTNFPQSCLSVVREASDENTVLYQNCQTGENVFDSYIITENMTDNVYIVNGYFMDDQEVVVGANIIEINRKVAHEIFEDLGLLLALMVTVTLFMIGTWSPSAAIALGGIGFILTAYIGFYKLLLQTAILIFIAMFFLIYKMRQ